MCACVTVVLGFAAHSIISGFSSNDAKDEVPDDEDRYDSLGYGFDFEEFLDDYFE